MALHASAEKTHRGSPIVARPLCEQQALQKPSQDGPTERTGCDWLPSGQTACYRWPGADPGHQGRIPEEARVKTATPQVSPK